MFERNLEILRRLWEEDMVTGGWDQLLRSVRMLPRPVPPAAGPHRRIRRPGAAPGGHQERRLARPTSTRPTASVAPGRRSVPLPRRRAGIPTSSGTSAQLPFCVADSYEKRRPVGPPVRRRLLRRRTLERVDPGELDPRYARTVRRAACRTRCGRLPAHRAGAVQLRARPGRALRRRRCCRNSGTWRPGPARDHHRARGPARPRISRAAGDRQTRHRPGGHGARPRR